MSHRPYPSTARARHQLARHARTAAPAVPGLTLAEASANLASWGRAWAPTFEPLDETVARQPLTLRLRARRAARTYWTWNELGWLAIRRFDTPVKAVLGSASVAAWAYGVSTENIALMWAPAAYALAWLIATLATSS